MGIFTEGQDPLNKPGLNPSGRMPITQQQIDAATKYWNQQHAGDTAAMYIGTTIALAAVLATAYALYRVRRPISTVADKAAVYGAAKGLRAARHIRDKQRSFVERVTAKADEDQS